MINLNTQYNLIAKNQYTATPKNTTQQRVAADTFTRTNNISFGSSIAINNSFLSKITDKLKKFYRTHISLPPEIAKEISDIKTGKLLDSETYLKLSEGTKEVLTKKVGKKITKAVDDTISCTFALKALYDRTYGHGGYQIVSIGHSPELITKAMEHLGVKVKFLPISGVSFCPSYETLEKKVSSSPNYLNFIKELGLTKEQIKESNQKILFLDYTAAGKTLAYLKQLFEKYFELPRDLIEFRSLNKDLRRSASEYEDKYIKLPQNIKFSPNFANKYITEYLTKTKAESFSNIPYLEYSQLNSVYEDIQGVNNVKGKLFNFKLLDKLEELGCLALKADTILKEHPLDQKTYNKLLTRANNILHGEGRPTITEAANEIVPRALSVKDLYDKTYGKGKYQIVSIGSSPSLMAKAMEAVGVETKYLPISDLIHSGYDDLEFAVENSPNYHKFLDELGLTKEKIEANDKKFVFIDYTSSGATLRKIKRLFKEFFKVSNDKIEFRSVNQDLYNIFNKQEVSASNSLAMDSLFNFVEKYMTNNRLAKYRIIPSLPCKEVDSVYRVMKEELCPISKLLTFHIQRTAREMSQK